LLPWKVASEEYVLNMLYDNALNDGPMMLDDPPCSVSNSLEGKNDILVVHDDTLIHESPIVFLNSPNHTIEEKYACVEKCLCGLQLSYTYKIHVCNHDATMENGTSNYFERGKHAIDCNSKI
jgi:hypothetical protein